MVFICGFSVIELFSYSDYDSCWLMHKSFRGRPNREAVPDFLKSWRTWFDASLVVALNNSHNPNLFFLEGWRLCGIESNQSAIPFSASSPPHPSVDLPLVPYPFVIQQCLFHSLVVQIYHRTIDCTHPPTLRRSNLHLTHHDNIGPYSSRPRPQTIGFSTLKCTFPTLLWQNMINLS